MSDVYSADTDDLDAFAERSGRDVGAFAATVDGLEAGRARLALLPLPWFVQTSALDRYRDLVAFVGENGRFVAAVSDALKRHGTHTPNGVYRAEVSLVDQALAASDADRLDDLEESLVTQGVAPDTAAAITAEVASALEADPTLSFGAATRAGFAAHQGITGEEAEQAERAFTFTPPEAAAILGKHFDEIAGRHGKGDQITIEDLQDAVDDVSLPPEARDVAYRLAADATLFTNLDVANQTDLSDEPLGNGFAWNKADGVIGRDDLAGFPAKDHQARILLAWHPLVETAGQGYDLTEVDSHASADDVVAFIEDEDIPAYVRLAVFDVYADRHELKVTEREVLEQELAFDGTTYGGGGTFLDAVRAPGQARTVPVAPVRTGPGGARGGSGGGAMVAAIAAQLIIAAGGFGWNQGRQARIAREGNPAVVHTDPLTGAETSVDPAELVGLSPAEAKAYVAYFAVPGTAPPEGADRIEPHPYLDPFGQWRMSDTNEPVWPDQANEPLSPGQYIDLQGRRRWSDTNQLVEQFPNRSQYQDDDGIWRWADTGAVVDEGTAGGAPETDQAGETVVTAADREKIGSELAPLGWQRRVADNGRGMVWQRPGASGNADLFRIMEPTASYPHGYARFYNAHGQPMTLAGKPGPPSETHIPLGPDGSVAMPDGWP